MAARRRKSSFGSGNLSALQSRRTKGGSETEAAVLQWSQLLKLQKRLILFIKVPTSMAIASTTPRGDLICRPKEKAFVDFVGLLPSGKAICLESKKWSPESEGTRFQLSRVEPHQQQILTAAESSGALAAVLIFTPKATYCVPWSSLLSGSRLTSSWSRYLVKGHDFLAPLEGAGHE